MKDGVTIIDHTGTYGTYFVAAKILHDEKSEYQRITVFENATAGRVLALDSIFNVSTQMEAFYHEPMAHIPLAMLEGPLDVLIIGGGDFGVARQVLKHRHVRRLVLCELDRRVVEVCREFFPEWAKCEQDERLHCHIGDGRAYVADCPPESFDAVIIDSTDPFEGAPMLASDEFYHHTALALKPGGVLMQIVADFVIFRDAWRQILPRARRHFQALAPIALPIPFYLTGPWGLMLAGRERAGLPCQRVSAEFLASIGGTMTMTPELVVGWFSLPPCLKQFLASIA